MIVYSNRRWLCDGTQSDRAFKVHWRYSAATEDRRQSYDWTRCYRACRLRQNSDFFPLRPTSTLPACALHGEQPPVNSPNLPSCQYLSLSSFRRRRHTSPDPTERVEPSANSTLVRDRYVRAALAIRRGIVDGGLDDLDPSSASDVLLIDAARDGCSVADAGAQKCPGENCRAQHQRPHHAAYPQCGPASQAIWNRITSSVCYRAAAADQKEWVNLFAAIASRNSSDIVKFGGDLIRSASRALRRSTLRTFQRSPPSVPSYIGLGQCCARVGRLLKEQSKKLNPAESYWFPLLDLLALTQSGQQRALAPAGR